MEEIYSFGYWVMRRRKALDLTRVELAQRISCSAETIKKIERDERRPSRQVAELLAAALAVPEEDRGLFIKVARGEIPVDSLPLFEKPLPISTISHNLPPQTTPFVGREAELEALARYLADPATRMVTILGPGGMGKTRLGLAAAEAQLRHPGQSFPHGIHFVALAPLESPEQLLPAIAEALRFRFYSGGEPRQQLLDYLRHKQLLLVLDNFEHLKAGAGLADELLAGAPGIKLLVTSRERLNRQAEQIFPIGGLDLPDVLANNQVVDDEWADSGAIRLFVQSAWRIRPEFALTSPNRPHVHEICRLVDGAPLGIVLAASWLGALPVVEIAAEMRRDLDFLAVEMADVPERQRSLRAAFNYSWRLLSEPEQSVFRRLSVFRGGFDRRAAMAVAEASPRDLQALVNKSLLVRNGDRYEVHELLRQFAVEKLAGSPDEQATAREAHSAYFCDLLRELKDDWHNARQLEALRTVAVEADNIRPALQWALERDAWPRLGVAIDSWASYLEWQAHSTEGASFCRAIATRAQALDYAGLTSPECLRVWVMALTWASVFGQDTLDFQSSSDSMEQSLALLDRTELAGLEVRREKAFACLVKGRAPVADWRKYSELSLALYQELEEPWGIAESLDDLAYADAVIDGHLIAALEKQKIANEIHREIGNRRAQTSSLNTLALIHKHLGRLDEAEYLQRESLRLSLELDERNYLIIRYGILAYTLCWQGRYEEAIDLAKTAYSLAKEMGRNRDLMIDLVIAYNLIHAGQYAAAHRHLEKASSGNPFLLPSWNNRFLNTVKGELALANSTYAEGQAALVRSVGVSRESANYLLGATLSDLALAEYHLNEYAATRAHLVEALAGAITNQNYPSVMFSLPATALLLANSGDAERAVEIWALAQRMPILANSRYYEDLAWREVAAAADSVPPDFLAVARERGRALDLWKTAGELLTWLESQA